MHLEFILSLKRAVIPEEDRGVVRDDDGGMAVTIMVSGHQQRG